MFIIDDLIIVIAQKIQELAEQEKSESESKIKEELMELQLRFEFDEMTEEEYNRQEKELLVRLEAARKEGS